MKTLWKHLTTFWSKIPAWVQVILINLFILMPVVVILQSILQINLVVQTQWGWALLIVIPLLYGFWRLAQGFSRFNRPQDVKIELNVNLANGKFWLRLTGLVLITFSSITLFSVIFDAYSEQHLAFFSKFFQFDAITAVPLLIGISLSAGVVEEVIYRGYIQNKLMRQYPKYIVFFGIGLLFAIMHFLPLALILPYVLVSMSFSMVADEFKSLGVVIMAHVIVDIIFLLSLYMIGTALFNSSVSSIILLVALFTGSVFCLLYKSALGSKLFKTKNFALEQ